MSLSSRGGGGQGGSARFSSSEHQHLQFQGGMVHGLRKWKDQNRREYSPERTKVWTEPPPKLKNSNISTSCTNNTAAVMATECDDQGKKVVAVVYYLSRNGQLEHPHFINVPLPSRSDGLYLRDVTNRLNVLRGKGMASQYAWSSKRSYKNGYIWHDLEENDFIHPVHGHEYVLKGSEILRQQPSLLPVSSSNYDITASSSSNSSSNSKKHPQLLNAEDADFPVIVRGPPHHQRNHSHNIYRNQSWSSIDLHEYKVYKTDSIADFSSKAAADAATQTEDKRRRRRQVVKVEDEEGNRHLAVATVEEQQAEILPQQQGQSTELRREDISPPPSDSSPETLESLMKADGRLLLATTNNSRHPQSQTPLISQQKSSSSSSTTMATTNNRSNETAVLSDDNQNTSGRMKASSVLMSLFSCGSISFRDCGAAAVKDHGFSLVSPSHHNKSRLPRGGNQSEGKQGQLPYAGVEDYLDNDSINHEDHNSVASSSFAKMALEDREYFSGSLLVDVAKKDELVPSSAALKRSSSYNADRSSRSRLEEKDGVRAKCIPRKPKMSSTQQHQQF